LGNYKCYYWRREKKELLPAKSHCTEGAKRLRNKKKSEHHIETRDAKWFVYVINDVTSYS